MPIYEYICHACGEEFEALQKFSDAPLKSCQCGKNGSVERKLSLSAFHLQGGGWYKDKYGGSNGKAASTSGNGAGDGAGNGAGDGAKSEAKDSKSTGTGDSSAKEKTNSGASNSSSKSDGKSKPAGGSGAAT